MTKNKAPILTPAQAEVITYLLKVGINSDQACLTPCQRQLAIQALEAVEYASDSKSDAWSPTHSSI
jgi:hypothetical protein